jgi:hypothetical protein
MTIALLGLLLVVQPAPSIAEGLSAYAARLCAEAGIAEDACAPADLAEPATAIMPASTGGKTATLIEHGRWLCAKEGVPADDCIALPTSYRHADPEAGLSPFLTMPASIPLANLPAARAAAAPGPPLPAAARAAGQAVPLDLVPRPVVRYVAPPSPPVAPIRSFAPAPFAPAAPEIVVVGEPLPAAAGGVDGFPAPLPADAAGEAFFAEEPRERLLRDGPDGRCRRSVIFSRFPSYRYVTC